MSQKTRLLTDHPVSTLPLRPGTPLSSAARVMLLRDMGCYHSPCERFLGPHYNCKEAKHLPGPRVPAQFGPYSLVLASHGTALLSDLQASLCESVSTVTASPQGCSPGCERKGDTPLHHRDEVIPRRYHHPRHLADSMVFLLYNLCPLTRG